jgi:SAM-dependent methyltransferase
MTVLNTVHGRWVHTRRVRVLAERICPLLVGGWQVADVGAGDGSLGARLLERVPGLRMVGYDVLVRPRTAIPVMPMAGGRLPLPNGAVDAVLLVDVLHHTADPLELLREAARVARRAIVIKDHRTARPLARPTLRFMDHVGNRRHGVALPCNYWSDARWQAAWSELGLTLEHYQTRLGLYPRPAKWLFEDGLHFLARLRPRAQHDSLSDHFPRAAAA